LAAFKTDGPIKGNITVFASSECKMTQLPSYCYACTFD